MKKINNLIYFDSTIGNFFHLLPVLIFLKSYGIDFNLFLTKIDVYKLAIRYFSKNKIILYKKKKNFFSNFLNLFKTFFLIKKLKVNNFINLSLHNQYKNKILNVIIKKKNFFCFKIKKEKKYKNVFYYNFNKSEANNYKLFFEYIFKLKIKYLNILKINKKKLNQNITIGFHVGSSKELIYKRWNINNYIFIIKKLLKKNYQIKLHGNGRDEELLNNKIFAEVNDRKLKNLSNSFNLHELGQEIKKYDLFIGNDSGVLQYASFLGVPTVVIFGPTSEIKNKPLNKKFLSIRCYSDVYCNKKTNSICDNCLNNKKYQLNTKCMIKANLDKVYLKIINFIKIL